MTISSMRDIRALEESNIDPMSGLGSTYEMIAGGAAIDPESKALSFFLRSEDFKTPATWTYVELLADITRATNMFRRLGVEGGDVVAYIMPNLPETHIALWGAETAGIAFAVNPLLDGSQMGQLLQAANTRWIVTVGSSPDAEIWKRVESAAESVTQLRGVLCVDALKQLPGYDGSPELPATLGHVPVLDFHRELARESGDELNFAPPGPEDIASYFCTGGTTGLPKIAQHTHRNETANAFQTKTFLAGHVVAPGQTVLTALPLFHVNAQLCTGLTIFPGGGHVLLATAGGYRTAGLIEHFAEGFAKAERPMILSSWGSNRYLNSDLINRTKLLCLSLKGAIGKRGAGYQATGWIGIATVSLQAVGWAWRW